MIPIDSNITINSIPSTEKNISSVQGLGHPAFSPSSGRIARKGLSPDVKILTFQSMTSPLPQKSREILRETAKIIPDLSFQNPILHNPLPAQGKNCPANSAHFPSSRTNALTAFHHAVPENVHPGNSAAPRSSSPEAFIISSRSTDQTMTAVQESVLPSECEHPDRSDLTNHCVPADTGSIVRQNEILDFHSASAAPSTRRIFTSKAAELQQHEEVNNSSPAPGHLQKTFSQNSSETADAHILDQKSDCITILPASEETSTGTIYNSLSSRQNGPEMDDGINVPELTLSSIQGTTSNPPPENFFPPITDTVAQSGKQYSASTSLSQGDVQNQPAPSNAEITYKTPVRSASPQSVLSPADQPQPGTVFRHLGTTGAKSPEHRPHSLIPSDNPPLSKIVSSPDTIIQNPDQSDFPRFSKLSYPAEEIPNDRKIADQQFLDKDLYASHPVTDNHFPNGDKLSPHKTIRTSSPEKSDFPLSEPPAPMENIPRNAADFQTVPSIRTSAPGTEPGIRPGRMPLPPDNPLTAVNPGGDLRTSAPKTKPGIRPERMPLPLDNPLTAVNPGGDLRTSAPKTKPGIRPEQILKKSVRSSESNKMPENLQIPNQAVITPADILNFSPLPTASRKTSAAELRGISAEILHPQAPSVHHAIQTSSVEMTSPVPDTDLQTAINTISAHLELLKVRDQSGIMKIHLPEQILAGTEIEIHAAGGKLQVQFAAQSHDIFSYLQMNHHYITTQLTVNLGQTVGIQIFDQSTPLTSARRFHKRG